MKGSSPVHDPWTVLNLDPSADEATIRRRYLELVRENPPDHNPVRFNEIREAYDLARDPTRRLEALLFGVRDDDHMDGIIATMQGRLVATRLPTESLLRLEEIQ